ncbi:MAG: class II glutamine amidotransferase [Myxococcota bacterium]|nr:class II glutamine amidotransferase [Myxococcota bacterium]
MGLLLGYVANRADALAEVLAAERDALRLPPTREPVAWGVGFYQGGEVLHRKRPQLDGPVDWPEIVEGIRTDCAILHVRTPTVGGFRLENTHPFRMRIWQMAHHGTIPRFSAVREALIAQMPDFLRRNIRGETDSEHYFHAVLAFLHDAGVLDTPEADGRAVLPALRSAVAQIDRLVEEAGGGRATLNAVLTDGRSMWAVRRGSPMRWVQRRIEPGGEGRRGSDLRYVLVVSGPEPPQEPGYRELADSSVLVVTRALQTTVFPLA